MTLSPATPPPIEALSPDLQFKLWERDRNRLKRSWIFTLLLCSPAIAFIFVKPVHDAVETVYQGASFLHWLTGLASLPQAGTGAATVPAGTAGLSADQATVAQAIIQAGVDRSLDQSDIKLALMTAMQESSMKNLDHGDDWYFAQWGEKSDSVGAFQQRDSWGSRECRMDVKCSANLFYDALLQVSDRHSMPEWKAIATVQRPAAQYEQHYQQWDEKADEILKAVQATPVSATAGGKTVPFKGIQVTSAKDASGEPGLDYVVSDGDRGAEFGALVAGTVVKTVTDQHWESHLEAGGQERGYGNQVIIRVKDEETGEEVDMLYAHLDRVDVQEGDRLAVGSVVGTQGRTGSTTGAHVSVDFFAAGTLTASPASLAMRDRIAQVLQSNPEALNQQVAAQPPAAAPQEKSGWDLSRIQLPFFQSPPAPSKPEMSVFSYAVGDGKCGAVAVAPDRLVTANHCIKATELTIVPNDGGEWLKGAVVKQSADLDLALIQVDGANFPVLPPGKSPTAGEAVTAIGFPLNKGSQLTITQTTVQAIDQFCQVQEPCFTVPAGVLSGGFSGGAMVDASGRLVGINRAIKEATGVGYAIPIATVLRFVAQRQAIETVKEFASLE